MKFESYNKELLFATAQFLDVFNDITIHRNSGKSVRVKCVHGTRSRIFKSLENPVKTPIQPPIISVQRSGFSRDVTRVVDLNRHLLENAHLDHNSYPPVPISIAFEMTIVSKYQEDMDMILTNFIPFANQSFFVKTPNPKFPDETINHEVIWSGEITEEDTSEVSVEVADLHTATTSFTFKTWIWPGKGVMSEPDGIIKKINLQPALCSIGTQQFLLKNGVETIEELEALSGFTLDANGYGDIYSLSHWYTVPTHVSFNEFESRIELGRISNPCTFDTLPISAGVSGYVGDLNLGLDVGDAFNLSDDEVKYFVDNEGGIVIYTDTLLLEDGELSAVCMPEIM